jgi:hypothetical protein
MATDLKNAKKFFSMNVRKEILRGLPGRFQFFVPFVVKTIGSDRCL